MSSSAQDHEQAVLTLRVLQPFQPCDLLHLSPRTTADHIRQTFTFSRAMACYQAMLTRYGKLTCRDTL